MLKTYLTISLRFLKKNKVFSFIDIIGLAIGTLCCLYILLYVREEFSYDTHHQNVADIYRVNSQAKLSGDKHSWALASPPIAPAMKNDFGEVLQFTRVVNAIGIKQHLLRYRERSVYEADLLFVDSTFFDVFTYRFLNGDAREALADPYSVVLMKPLATKLFGDKDPVGELIEIDNAYGKQDFKVTGVIDESLGKSHIHANMFITMNSGGIGQHVLNNREWAGNNFTASYVKLHSGADPAALEKKLPGFLNTYGQQQLQNMGMEKVLQLQPVRTIHTTTGYEGEMSKTVSPSFLHLLLLIAALTQIIACINFINLSTAYASKRAKEVGIRKVVGAQKGDFMKQFLSESVVLAMIGVLIALPLLIILLPYLNQITQANIRFSSLMDYRVGLVMLGFIVLTGLIAGSYPALYLSAFEAVKTLKGNFNNRMSPAYLRRTLTVFQFIISIVLIVSIIVIYNQLNYIKNKDLGFDKEQTLIFTFHTDDAKKQIGPFSNDLQQLSEVKAASKTNNYPTQLAFNDIGVFLAGGNAATSTSTQFMYTDEYITEAIGIELVGGRNLREGDSSRVLINEMLAKELGLDPATAEGTKLYTSDPSIVMEVAGVVKDFNYTSLHESVKPFMLVYSADNSDYLIVNAHSQDYQALLRKMEEIWRKNIPAAMPFEYTFLDDEVQKQYEAEITFSNIINSFAFMAIFISCLGLFGLAAFSVERRMKEVGIRKVLGANVFNIAMLLSRDFLVLIVIALVIAVPIAWWAMNQWLENFAYRISITWWMFVLAGLLAVLIALITVSFHTIKAGLVNPTRVLKAE